MGLRQANGSTFLQIHKDRREIRAIEKNEVASTFCFLTEEVFSDHLRRSQAFCHINQMEVILSALLRRLGLCKSNGQMI